MGVSHVHDSDGFRRTTLVPPKRPGSTRVIVVGDSYTYGYGVAESRVFASRLEADLQDRGIAAEVINLGKLGLQAEDVLKLVRERVFSFGPDAIVYAVTSSDYLPAGERWGNHTVRESANDPSTPSDSSGQSDHSRMNVNGTRSRYGCS